jgi:hypothetical protein
MSTLLHVEAAPVFLGPYWQTHGNDAFFLALNTAAIVNSPFMDALGKAGYGEPGHPVGRGNVSGSQILQAGGVVAGATVTDLQVQQILAVDIMFSQVGGSLPPPDANRLYEVFLPPNVTFTANYNHQTLSSNTGLTGWNSSFSFGATQIHYVVIPYQGGTNASANGHGTNLDAFTETMSHEIAEAVTGVQCADNTEGYHYRMSNGVAIQEVGQPNDYNTPIQVAGANKLPY